MGRTTYCTDKKTRSHKRVSLYLFTILVFEASRSREAILHLLPHPFDSASVVVAIRQIVIQRGEAVLLASLLHLSHLLLIELWLIDIAPIEIRGIHRETGPNRSIRPMMTLFWPARHDHSAKLSSPSGLRSTPGMPAIRDFTSPLPLVPSPYQPTFAQVETG